MGMGRSEEQVALQPGQRPGWWCRTVGECSQAVPSPPRPSSASLQAAFLFSGLGDGAELGPGMRPWEAGLPDRPLARKGSDAETLDSYFSLHPLSRSR